MPVKRGSRRVPNVMRRLQPAVGATPLPALAQAPAAPHKKRSPKQATMEPETTLWKPKLPKSVVARRERRASQPEQDEVLGGAPVQGKRETQFTSDLNARGVGPAPRIGARAR